MNNFLILLVEDDAIERLKFQRASKKLKGNFTIIEAKNGKCALKHLKESKIPFNLIISDFNMPVMNGFEFLKEVKSKAEYKNIPFIIMSNTNELNELKKCKDLGIAGYFTKPSSITEYTEKVKVVLKYWNQNIQIASSN